MKASPQRLARALLLDWFSLALRAVEGRARVRIALAAPDITALLSGHRAVAVFAVGKASGGLIHTGATGTNVGDLVIGLARMV